MANRKEINYELLAPAGGKEPFIAAVENGADAVYVGGPLYSARAHAENFSEEQFGRAVAFAHQRGVKVHAAVNTLLTDGELAEALRFCGRIREMGVDAVIVQDFGLAGLLLESFPDLPLHLSTQAGVYDVRGAEAARDLGFRRAVLARETPLSEIRRIAESVPELELEAFVHGALCVCWSGQCQFSRKFGGRSGNRGLCAQPCRLPYERENADGSRLDGSRYPLSPKDLCLIDRIGDLVRAGVTSFKIEGRMKSPEYVAVVTQIYRKVLDQVLADGRSSGGSFASEKDREALLQIYSRGGFTEGCLDGPVPEDFMSGDLPKHQGLRVGTVVRGNIGVSRPGGKNGNGRGGDGVLADVELDGPLEMGDGFEIHAAEPVSGLVTYRVPVGGKKFRIGDVKKPVRNGDPVFRTSSKGQLEEARRTFENIGWTQSKYHRRLPIALRLTEEQDGTLKLTAAARVEQYGKVPGSSDPYLAQVTVETGPFVRVAGASLRQRAESQLVKTGGTPFVVSELTIAGPLDVDVKVSELNDLRRRALDELADVMARGRAPMAAHAEERVQAVKERADAMLSPFEWPEMVFYSWDDFEAYRAGEDVNPLNTYVLPLEPALRHADELGDIDVIPYIRAVTQGKENDWIEAHFEEIVDKTKKSGIYIGALGWIAPFVKAGVPVYADSGLNCWNRAAEVLLLSLGVERIAPSLEAMRDYQGIFPLMVLRARPEGAALVRSDGTKIRIVKPEDSDLTLLLPGEPGGHLTRIVKKRNNY